MTKLVLSLLLLSSTVFAADKNSVVKYVDAEQQACSQMNLDLASKLKEVAKAKNLKEDSFSSSAVYRNCRTWDYLCQSSCIVSIKSTTKNLVEIDADKVYGKERNQDCEKKALELSQASADVVFAAVSYDQGWTFYPYCQAWSVSFK
jgi:hypothetical protein